VHPGRTDTLPTDLATDRAIRRDDRRHQGNRTQTFTIITDDGAAGVDADVDGERVPVGPAG